MSGGSHNYACYCIEENLSGQMKDRELDDLMKDLVKLTHDLEWADSADISQEEYFETVKRFKNKWFGTSREERLKEYIDEAVSGLRDELLKML